VWRLVTIQQNYAHLLPRWGYSHGNYRADSGQFGLTDQVEFILSNRQENIMDFTISALDLYQFSHLFGQSVNALSNKGIQRMVVDSHPGYPCRVSLRDVDVGETVLLLNYEHQSMRTPYRSSHAIFVQEYAKQAILEKNEVPQTFRHRLLSLRAFDLSGMMVDADIIDGDCLESLIERMLSNMSAEYLHIHNARRGCYAALVRRD
jgi:hypothetical protein